MKVFGLLSGKEITSLGKFYLYLTVGMNEESVISLCVPVCASIESILRTLYFCKVPGKNEGEKQHFTAPYILHVACMCRAPHAQCETISARMRAWNRTTCCFVVFDQFKLDLSK